MVCFEMWAWDTVGLAAVIFIVIFALGFALGRKGTRFSRTR